MTYDFSYCGEGQVFLDVVDWLDRACHADEGSISLPMPSS